DQARARSTEIGRGVDQEYVLRQVGGQAPLVRLLSHPEQLCLRLGDGKATGHHDKNIRGCGLNLIPRHNTPWATGLCQDILTAGELDHFRNPMARDVQWREPFDTDDARAMRDVMDSSPYGVQSIT